MNEEQFNRFEELARKAALQDDHPFDETSWKKMEALLDQEKDRRRFVPWWWISLAAIIIACGLYWFLRDNRESGQLASSSTSVEQPPVHSKQASETEPAKADKPVTQSPDQDSQSSAAMNLPPAADDGTMGLTDKAGKQHAGGATVHHANKSVLYTAKQSATTSTESENVNQVVTGKAGASRRARKKSAKSRSNMNIQSPDAEMESSVAVVPAKPQAKDAEGVETPVYVPATSDTLKTVSASKDDMVSAKQVTDTVSRKADTSVQQPVASQTLADLLKQKRIRGFYLLGGIGADISSVKLFSFRNSPVSPRFGVGIGYQINRRWSVQTGFYASRKRYLAGPEDYKTGSGGYWTNTRIISVDANCLVYEIPLQVRFNVFEKGRQVFYAIAGISSYLMQKETYDYTLIRNGYYDPYRASYSFSGNRHPFSVLSLSAGIQQQLGKRTGLLVEPYVQLPMGGVGEGSIRLYSFGIQTGLRYRLEGAGRRQKK